MRSEPKVPATLVLMLFALAGCAGRQAGDPLEPAFNVYSPAQDIEIGRQAAAEVNGQVEIVQDRSLQDYVSTLGERLASHNAAGPYPYSFTLINDPAINAFALPGGPIYIHTGLIEAASNESQLAGVLAHEISHVALRHGTSQASKSSLAQIPAVLAGAVIGQESTLAQLGQLGVGFGLNSLFLKYSRTAEQEADALGARLMAGAGYNPLEMAGFFEVLDQGGGSRPPQFLSSHPDPGNRVEAVRAEIQTFDSGPYDAGTGRFEAVHAQVAALPDPSSRPVAFPTAQALSSGDFEVLQGRRYSMAYPESWGVYGGDGSDVTTIAPPEGLVGSPGNVSLGFGAVASFIPTSGGSLQSLTDELIGELRSVNRGLDFVGSPGSAVIDGNPALVSVLSGPSPYGGFERDVLVTVRHPAGLFYAVFVAPDGNFEAFEPTFIRMYQSIRF